MLVGVDFDNTIVCYDRLFHALAAERGLIPAELPQNKTAVRDYLRSVGREDDWTELQGIAYGPEIGRAEPFPGVLEFFRECKRRGVPTAIVSHKTRHPYRGEKHDLHAAAKSFLRQHGFHDEAATGLSDANTYLELTKKAKLARIATIGCTRFVDDLPEFLGEAGFPANVQRVLFDPDRRYPDDPRWRRMTRWSESHVWLPSFLAGEGPEVRSEPPNDAIHRLLASAKISYADFRLDPVSGGGNNRGYRLTTSDGQSRFLKWYFRHPDDPRDRLGTEFDFTQFCRRHGIDDVPQPFARDEASGLALYEFIEGRRLTTSEIDEAAINAAVSFFRRLNEHRGDVDAAALPIASEACFSICEHLDRIGGRVERLITTAVNDGPDAEFREFVDGRLAPTWNFVRQEIMTSIGDERSVPAEPLPADRRRLTPSDFGFHNALRTPDGRLRFIDLEYAGWDDPAKTVCDFFCQVQVPVPSRYWNVVCEAIVGAERPRAERLYPAYVVKWCCIVLNVFLPIGAARRSFGTSQSATAADRSAKLQLAHNMLDKLSFHR